MESTSRTRVAFRPAAAALGRDMMFCGEYYRHVGDASHWMEPTWALARIGLAHGIEFHTDDMVDLADSDVLVFGDLPASRRDISRIRHDHPHLKLILQILETPIGRAWTFDPANHSDFDAVVSYNPALNDGKRYFGFRIPAGGLGSRDVPSGASWRERKVACMIANVPNARPVYIRRSGAGLVRRGWRLTPRTWWHYVSEGGSLYRERLRIARQSEETLGGQFDIFGPGWPKAHSGSPRGKGFASARGPYAGSKLDLLPHYRFTIAYENCLNDCGYITEKLFDGLLAGCVPVYLGNHRIERLVPPDAFVDARRFASRRQLAEFLAAMPEGRWRQMRAAGEAFVRDEAVPLFGSMQYIDAIFSAVRQVTSASDVNPERRLAES